MKIGRAWSDDFATHLTEQSNRSGGKRFYFLTIGRLSLTWDTDKVRTDKINIADILDMDR